jgi:hypothetical protein
MQRSAPVARTLINYLGHALNQADPSRLHDLYEAYG